MSSLQATPRDVTKNPLLGGEKICPGETRIAHQLALQYLQVGGTGWSGVEVAASGSHLVRSQRRKGGRSCHKKSKKKREETETFPSRGARQWFSCRPCQGFSSLTSNSQNLVSTKNWDLGFTNILTPILRAGQKTWGIFATSRQEEPG